MEQDGWWNEYKKAVEEWKERMRTIVEEWKERMRETAERGAPSILSIPHLSMPPLPPISSMMPPRSNVVASRIGDEELRVIDMLVEAGLFTTRSEAVAYLVSEGIKARRDVIDKVSSALEEILRIRREAEEHVKKLRWDLGLSDSEGLKEGRRVEACPKCGRDLGNMPGDIAICPYCGFRMKKG